MERAQRARTLAGDWSSKEVVLSTNLGQKNSVAMPAFVLIDMLRSLHYGLPPTLASSEISPRPSSQNNHHTMNDYAFFNSSLPLPVLGQDDAFLALVAILDDIHALSAIFHLLELVSQYDGWGDKSPKSKNRNHNFQNPYLPFSPERENQQVRQKIQKALDLWRQNYLAVATQDVAALFYFCQMYLVLPSLLLLPEIVGYGPRSSFDSTQKNHRARILDSDLAHGSEALKNAWLILENVIQSENLPPVWIPIVLFYASLVVWRMVSLQTGTRKNGMSSKRRHSTYSARASSRGFLQYLRVSSSQQAGLCHASSSPCSSEA